MILSVAALRLRIFGSLVIGLLPVALIALTVPAFAQSVSFQGQTFVNKGLVGVARVPSNDVDKFGDTVSLGSGMAVLPGSWRKKGDGSYTGRFLMLPDRGWNTSGTVDYAGRLHRYEVTLKPYTGAGPTTQDLLNLPLGGDGDLAAPLTIPQPLQHEPEPMALIPPAICSDEWPPMLFVPIMMTATFGLIGSSSLPSVIRHRTWPV